MTPEQLATLRAHIAASPDLANQPAGPDGAVAIAALLNLPADPAFTAWKTSVTEDEIFANGMDWTRVDNLSVGKARGQIKPGDLLVTEAIGGGLAWGSVVIRW